MITLQKEQRINRPGELMDYISASRLKCWLSCKEKFRLQYVLGVEQGYSPALHLGKCIHSTLEILHGLLTVLDHIDPELSHEDFEVAYNQPAKPVTWKDGKQQEKLRVLGHAIIDTYLTSEYLELLTRSRLSHVEVSLEAVGKKLPMRLVGNLDLIRNGRIVDFKTVAGTPSNLDLELFQHRIQLMAYQVLCEQTGVEVSGFEMVFLVKTKVPKIITVQRDLYTPEELEEFYSICEEYHKSLCGELGIRSSGMQCSWCGYRNTCLKGALLPCGG